MSKDIIVLAPNGRRSTIHCTADTSILQILEDACHKQGFHPSDYDLKHHKHILDLSTTIRFSNLPNKATVEMVEVERKRQETNVTVGLLLEDGERRTADFPPQTSLLDLVMSLAESEFKHIHNPCILYMRQEVTGAPALKGKTLRMLGLIKGRAILRLLDKAEEAKQANVSAMYRVPLSDVAGSGTRSTPGQTDNNTPGPSHKSLDPVSLIKSMKHPNPEFRIDASAESELNIAQENTTTKVHTREVLATDCEPAGHSLDNVASNTNISLTEEKLERRLNIENEVTFLGPQKAVVYMQPDNVMDEIEDLPDEFYDLTIEEVRKLYHDLQQNRVVLENTPLVTAKQREDLEEQTSQLVLSAYKNVVIRIQFPDRIILQGIFQPNNTIEDITNFVKEHLRIPNKEFVIFTSPLKENLDPKKTLLEAKFVPCVHMHFKWLNEESDQTYLKEEIYGKKTSCEAASILASKYRAPTRRKMESGNNSKSRSVPSTSKNSKMPKWFKN